MATGGLRFLFCLCVRPGAGAVGRGSKARRQIDFRRSRTTVRRQASLIPVAEGPCVKFAAMSCACRCTVGHFGATGAR